jgi:soluble lytic murein transglycosylase
MSSMVRIQTLASLLLVPVLTASAPVQARDAESWDQARASLVASQPGQIAPAIDRWQRLSASPQFGFEEYASFLLSYPGFPFEAKMRGYAEAKLEQTAISPERITAFFDRFPPLTNPAKAQYALALAALGRPQAAQWARDAWRGGPMSASSESALLARFGRDITPADHDARMDALLWNRDTVGAQRQFAYVSAGNRQTYMARMSLAQGSNPAALGMAIPGDARSDPGYLFNSSRQLRRAGRTSEAASLLASRPRLSSLPISQTDWIEELLTTARATDSRTAQRIAASADDAFPQGTDISTLGFKLRDDYTSLMWLGGTKSLWELGDARSAAPLFYRYGAAARTPQTRSKGFYWAGLASDRGGDGSGARRYFEMAANYPDQYYGLLALERLGRSVPELRRTTSASPTSQERAQFYARPLTAAVREVARNAPWSTSVRFFREIADQARSEDEHVLVHELAKTLGRRDLAVINGDKAAEHGFNGFHEAAFPTLPAPAGTNWTMVHAITRQESQFAQNAVSHAGARGLMQLMPGTAQEQAGKLGMQYLSASLINDPGYNMQLGNGYFGRMLNYYGGSYPLAVAAYNAGPGNVNKWLARNGDPRRTGQNWVEWVEKIPIFETRNYVQRVLENAVVYQRMNPEKAGYGGPKSVSWFLGKNTPG